MVYQSNLEFFERLSGSHLLVMGGTGFVGKWIIAVIGYAIESGNPMKLSVMSRSRRDVFEDFKNAPFEMNWIIADLSLGPQLNFEEYTNYILHKNLKDAIQLIYEIYDKGYSVMDILDNYFIFVKSTNILSEEQKYKIIPCICKYISIFHNIHEDEYY
jgi:hypothetical protein